MKLYNTTVFFKYTQLWKLSAIVSELLQLYSPNSGNCQLSNKNKCKKFKTFNTIINY